MPHATGDQSAGSGLDAEGVLSLWLSGAERFCSDVRPRIHAAREIVFAPEDKPWSVFLLLEGSIRLFRISPDGTELCTGYVGPGEIFGEEGALSGLVRDEFAETVSASRIVRLDVEVFRQILLAHSSLALQIATQLQRRLGKIKDRVECMIFGDALGRVARGLLELAETFGKPTRSGSGITIDIPVTQGQLATFVGTSRQTVNTSLRRFEEQGLTARAHRRIVVLDRAQLAQAARFTEESVLLGGEAPAQKAVRHSAETSHRR